MLAQLCSQQREDAQRQREETFKMTSILQQVLERLPERRSRSSTVSDSPPQAPPSSQSSISNNSSVREVSL